MLRQEPKPKLTEWSLSLLYLKEQEWVQNSLASDLHRPFEVPPKPGRFYSLFHHKQEPINWYEPNILQELSIPSSSSIFSEVFQSNLDTPYLWFFLGQYVDKTTQLHLGFKLQLQRDMLSKTSSTLINFTGCQDYLLLLDKNELQAEVKNRVIELENAGVVSQLKDMNLTDICENMSQKLDSIIYPEKKKALFSKIESTIDKLEQEKKLSKLFETPVQKDWMKELPIPLQNSLPSMFLHRCFSPEVPKNAPQRELHPTPQFIQKLSKMVTRFSVLRHYTPEEVERMVRENKDWSTNKSDIQWHDPQEKWFYWDLPAINLFFDRFREDYRHTVVTNWEEPEKKLTLTDTEIGDEFDFSHAKDSPIFKYEGISEMKIGDELTQMESLIDQHSSLYESQVKQELEEEGAPEQLQLSWQSEKINQEVKKANEDL